MKPKLLLRIASVLILSNAVGHSIGHFTRRQTTDPVKEQVLRQMEEHKFMFGGANRSLYEFYTGNSLCLSIALFLLTVLLWIISSEVTRAPKTCIRLLVPMLCCFIAFTLASIIYFFLGPVLMEGIVSLLVFIVIMQLRSKTNPA